MRVRIPAAAEPGLSLWVALVGGVIGFAIASAVFGARAERLERELVALHGDDPTGAHD